MVSPIRWMYAGIILLFTSCMPDSDSQEQESAPDKITQATKVEKAHYNIVVAIDCSNRIDEPRTFSDAQLVQRLLHLFRSKIINLHNRDMDQNDRLVVKLINSPELKQNHELIIDEWEIDLKKYDKNQALRRDYLFGQDGVPTPFAKDSIRIVTQLKECQDKLIGMNNRGADVWEFLKKLGSYEIRNDTVSGSFRDTRILNVYKNKLIVLTDGYIETSNKQCYDNEKVCYDLKETTIKKFRQAVQASGSKPVEFFRDNGYGIYPLENPLLKGTDILILECDDRSLNRAGSAPERPTDFEIMELFWTDWLERAGAKVQIKPVVNSTSEFDEIIMEFMER